MNHRKLLEKTFGLMLIVLILAGCGGAQATPTATSTPSPTPVPPTPTPAASPEEGRVESGEITSQALANNLLGDPATRPFQVYLPPGYDTSNKNYPVVYALHYYGGDSLSLTEMAPVLDSLIASGEAHEMILVFPDASNRFLGSWYLNSPTIGDYESYIAQELVAYIDANYRTLPHRDSRGIAGCSMGGDGALHLALTYPEVYSVAAGVSGTYDYEHAPLWEAARKRFRREPSDFADFQMLPWQVQYFLARAAAAAPNPNKAPFYVDMPFEAVDGQGQIVPDVAQKINAVDTVHDVREYANQPVRLRGLMIYHGESDPYASVELIRDFDEMLTELGVEHEYLEINGGHCDLDYKPVLKFMSDHLAF